MAQIIVWVNGRRMARTDRAFALTAKYELMRERVLEFSVVNTDAARPYVIDPSAVYEYKGQKYDMKTYKQTSGTDNSTTAVGYHVLLRSKNYAIPAGYAFVGTLPEIIGDMLTVSGGNAEFSAGMCVNLGTKSFSLGNTQPLTLYDALYALRALGCEIYFDNFIINAPARLGSDTGKVFRFGRDLCSLERNYDKTTDPPTVSYAISIANLQRLPGGSPGNEFALGDTVGIQDSIIGDEIVGQRIVAYEEHDDPTKDSITIGAFALDIADTVSTMQVDIANSVQQDEQYSNVSIDHQNGFMAVSQDGLLKVTMSAANCFAVWTRQSTSDEWTISGELTVQGLVATCLSNMLSRKTYGIIGKGPDSTDGYGLFLVADTTDIGGQGDETFFKLYYAGYPGDMHPIMDFGDGEATLQSGDVPFIYRSGSDTRYYGDDGSFLSMGHSGTGFFNSSGNSYGANGATPVGQRPVFSHGICTGFTT